LIALLLATTLIAETFCESARAEGPVGLSAVSRLGNGHYLSVDDRGGWLYEATLAVSEGSAVLTTNRAVRLEGRHDLEGCAVDPLTGLVWVSDEADHSIRAFDPVSGRETAALEIPASIRTNLVANRSFEGLAISPDGLTLYAANETPLRGDPTNEVRLLAFSRASAAESFRLKNVFRYRVDPVAGTAFRGHEISGVSALAVLPDGSLLVLEREFSVKRRMPSFRSRLYRVEDLSTAAILPKTLVWEANTALSNYEGLALGPVLSDGSPSLLLVSDGGSEAEESLLLIKYQVIK